MRRLVFLIVCGGCLVALVVPGSCLAFGPVLSFGPYGTEPGQLSNPGGMAIGPDGASYVADTGNNRINVYSPTGVYARSLGKKAVPVGTGDCKDNEGRDGCDDGSGAAGVLRSPRDVVVDSAGAVFVADWGNSRIDVFSPAGAFIRAFGKGVNPAGGDVCTEATGCKRGSGSFAPGSVTSPLGIGIDATGLLYVTASSRIDVFTPGGAYVRSFGREATSSEPHGRGECSDNNKDCNTKEFEVAGAINSPYDVAVGANGQAIVADYGNDRVDVFAANGSFVRSFGKDVNPAGGNVCTEATGCKKGTEGGVAGAMNNPTAVAVNSAGNVYVADSTNNRIDEFTIDGTFVRAFGEGVLSGAAEFQACTPATGCKAGLSGTNQGSVPNPRGTAADCRGAAYAVEWKPGGDKRDENGGTGAPALSRVERFSEFDTLEPPCTDSGAPGSSSKSGVIGSAGPSRPGPHKTAKPLISVELIKASGTAVLIVIVSDPGTLTLKGKGIRKVKKHAKQRGEVELLVTPVGGLKRKLEESGKATVKLSLAFQAEGGGSIVQSKAIGLKMIALF